MIALGSKVTWAYVHCSLRPACRLLIIHLVGCCITHPARSLVKKRRPQASSRLSWGFIFVFLGAKKAYNVRILELLVPYCSCSNNRGHHHNAARPPRLLSLRPNILESFYHNLQRRQSSISTAMLMRFLPLLAVMAPYAFADVQFTSPSAGATVAGGTTLDVEWEDSGDKPPISQMTTYELFLCAGGNDEDNFVCFTSPRGAVVHLSMI